MLKGDRCMGAKCVIEKRAAKAPTRGGPRRRKVSDRGMQLKEKQKARYTYGVLERQFRKFFAEASRQEGITSDNLMLLLERRLDNVIYRLGFADTRPQARQLVRHGHIMVNGHRVDVPSYLVKPGEAITWHESSKNSEYYKALVEHIKGRLIPAWLGLDENAMAGQVSSLPSVDEIDVKFDGKAIVEYYSR